MTLRVDQVEYSTDAGPRTALVVTPTAPIRVGRERLDELRRGHEGGHIDQQVLHFARTHARGDRVIVFRGTSGDGQGFWRIDEELDDDEVLELGYHLVADQLATYRRLVAAGVFALMHVDWGERGVRAYRHGTERLRRQLEAESIPETSSLEAGEAAVQRVDRWILHHMTFFFEEPFEQVIEGVLTRQVPLLESRLPALREMVANLPASVID